MTKPRPEIVRAEIKRLAAKQGGVRQLGKLLGVSYSRLYAIMRGDMEAGPKVLEALGWRRTVTWTRRSDFTIELDKPTAWSYA